MKDIVIWSLQCVQDRIEHRKNSCELYGYDFMLDDRFQPWLIEVNSSPACDYSTAVTKRYVETGLEDLLKVMLDVRESEKKVDRIKSQDEATTTAVDTGRWQNIHKGAFIPKPRSCFGGTDLEVKGTKVSKTRSSWVKTESRGLEAVVPATDMAQVERQDLHNFVDRGQRRDSDIEDDGSCTLRRYPCVHRSGEPTAAAATSVGLPLDVDQLI
jgi:hypothetical protein